MHEQAVDNIVPPDIHSANGFMFNGIKSRSALRYMNRLAAMPCMLRAVDICTICHVDNLETKRCQAFRDLSTILAQPIPP